MKKTSSIVLMILTMISYAISSTSQASERRAFTKADLSQILKSSDPNSFESLDIYLNRAIAIKYEKQTQDEVKVDSKITHTTAEDIKKIVITDSTKLRITSILESADGLVISYDPNCSPSRECQMIFQRSGDNFYLTHLSEKKGYEDSVTRSVLPLFSIPRLSPREFVAPGISTTFYKGVYLMVMKKDVHNVTKETKKAKGY